MKNRILIFAAIMMVLSTSVMASWKFNPFTQKFDYYEGVTELSTATTTTPGIMPAADKAKLDAFSGVTTTTTTYTVKTSGGDFTSIQDALDYVGSGIIIPKVNVTVYVDDGEWTLDSNILARNVFPVFLRGSHTYTKNITSIQSSTGSAGSWEVVLNLDSVASMTVGDYVAILSPSGGSNPTYLAGSWPVTNVDALNSRVTVTTTHNAAVAPSGAVSGTLTVLKTVLHFTGNNSGVVVWNRGAFSVWDVQIKGDNSSGTGLSIQDESRFYNGGVIGISGFSNGLFISANAQANLVSLAVSSCQTAVTIQQGGGSLAAYNLIASGNTNGISADTGIIDSAVYGLSTGNTTYGWKAVNNSSFTGIMNATGNGTYGFRAESGAWINTTSATSSGNGTADFSMVALSQSDISDLLSTSSPTWNTIHLSGLTDRYVPFNLSSLGLSNSIIYQDSSNRLGIGTTSPAFYIDLSAASGSSMRLKNTSAQSSSGGAALRLSSNDSTNPLVAGSRMGAVQFAGWNGTAENSIPAFEVYSAATWSNDGSVNPTYTVFKTGPSAGGAGVERARIDSDGNVGIGTLSTYVTKAAGTNNKLEVMNGHIANSMTSAPTVTCPGASAASVDTGGTDHSGTISITGTPSTECSITFVSAFNTIQACGAWPSATSMGVVATTAQSTAGATFAATTWGSGQKLYYRCDGK